MYVESYHDELSCYVIPLIFYSTLNFFDLVFLRYFPLNSVTPLGDIRESSEYYVLLKSDFCSIFVSNKISFVTGCGECPYAFDRDSGNFTMSGGAGRRRQNGRYSACSQRTLRALV